MADIINLTALVLGEIPNQQIVPIGVASIYDVQPYIDANYPWVQSVVFNSSLTRSALYCKETLAQVIALANAPVTPPVPVTTFLDAYQSNTKAAYSMSKLFSGATKSFQIRRASDSTTLDIGFVNNLLDTASLATFLTATTGVITKWYDQSGNGNDCVFTNAPACIQSVLNGLPATRFNGTSNYGATGSFLSSAYDKSYTSISMLNKVGTGFTLHDNNTSFYSARDLVANQIYHNTGMSGGQFEVVSYQQDATKLMLEMYTYDGTNQRVFVNGAQYGIQNSALVGDKLNMSGAMTIGAIAGGGSFNWDGDMFVKMYMNTPIVLADAQVIAAKLAFDFGQGDISHWDGFGNSLTVGFGTTAPAPAIPGTSWPSIVAIQMGWPTGFTFTNWGQSGASTETLITNLQTFPAQCTYNFNGFRKKNVAIFLESRNSMATGDSAATAYAAIVTFVGNLRLLGYTNIIVCTCQASLMVPGSNFNLPNGSGVTTNQFETQRLIHNPLIISGAVANGYSVIDLGADPVLGSLTTIFNATYWQADGIHWTDAGENYFATNLIYPVLRPLIP